MMFIYCLVLFLFSPVVLASRSDFPMDESNALSFYENMMKGITKDTDFKLGPEWRDNEVVFILTIMRRKLY